MTPDSENHVFHTLENELGAIGLIVLFFATRGEVKWFDSSKYPQHADETHSEYNRRLIREIKADKANFIANVCRSNINSFLIKCFCHNVNLSNFTRTLKF